MQSFLQYHRFGRAVAAQVERDRETEFYHHGPRDVNSDSPLSSSDTVSDATLPLDHSDDTGDIEKAEYIASHENCGLPNSIPISPVPPPEARMREEALRPGMNRLATATTMKSVGTRLGNVMTGIEVRKRTTKEGGDTGKVFVVGVSIFSR